MEVERLRLLKELSPEKFAAMTVEEVVNPVSFWKQIYDKLTDDVPIAEEADILLDHNYDGVMELDNNLPPWWKGIFYLAIAFAPIYVFVQHFSDFGHSSSEAYAIEMQVAKEEVKAYLATQEDAVDESTVVALNEPDALSKGGLIYGSKCSVCHGKEGEGGIGPNLTDSYWLHGGQIGDVFKTIKDGVPEKGMIAWKAELRPRDIQEVASYIISINGTQPANAKEPQGDLYKMEETQESK